MARNKRGKEIAAGLKTKEDVQLAKTTGAYEVEIDNNIVESSSKPTDLAALAGRALKRAKRAIRRQARIRKAMNKKGTHSIENPKKLYTVLAQYHQLNYQAVKDAITENKIDCTVIDNTHLWINNVDEELLKTIKRILIACHFETKNGKEYKVRIAAYRSKLQVTTKREVKKPSNNTNEAKLAAKQRRKANNKAKALSWIGHGIRRKMAKKSRSSKRNNKYGSHLPAVCDTSSILKKLRKRIKKASQAVVQTEENKTVQDKSRASKAILQHKAGKHDKQLNFAA